VVQSYSAILNLMKKVDRKEPYLNSLARKLGHAAGLIARATQDFTANGSASELLVSAKPAKRGKRASRTRQIKNVSNPSPRKSVKKARGTHRQVSEKKK
jgi:hypothetical protein